MTFAKRLEELQEEKELLQKQLVSAVELDCTSGVLNTVAKNIREYGK